MTLLDGSQVSDRCPLGYLFLFFQVLEKYTHITSILQHMQNLTG